MHRRDASWAGAREGRRGSLPEERGVSMSAQSAPGTAPGKEPCDLLVSNGYVVTLDPERRVFERGAVAITDRRIVAVGRAEDMARLHRPQRILDARGGTIHPGFIDAHNHAVHTTCREILDLPHRSPVNVCFADWKADVTSADEHVATQLCCLELLRHGFTMFVEPGTAFDTDAVAAAAESIGVRAMLAGRYIWDQTDVMRHLGSLESRSLYDRARPTSSAASTSLGASCIATGTLMRWCAATSPSTGSAPHPTRCSGRPRNSRTTPA
jgi:hypothetical protein